MIDVEKIKELYESSERKVVERKNSRGDDEYSEYETTRTYEVQDIPIYDGFALTQIVIVPDVQTAKLILV